MGQTLTNGIYLPDEGERNSYSGLEANWRTLDSLILTVNGKAAPNVANTWTAAQTFTAGIAGDLTGNVTGNVTGDLTGKASRATADEDGTSIKTGYGKLAGSQTWTGNNTFTGNAFLESAFVRNTAIIPGNTPSSAQTITQTYAANSNATLGYSRVVLYDTGITTFEVATRNKFSNGALDPSGTYTESKMSVGLDNTGLGYFSITGKVKNSLTPFTNSTYSLGSSSYQWSSVYAQTYYYNGTQWGLDKANVWSGDNSFTSSQLTLKNSNITRGTIPNTNRNYVLSFTDSNNDNVGMISQQVRAGSGSYKMTFSLNNGTTDHRFNFFGFTNGTSSLIPEASGVTELGSSDNKWKTLNGINPGALSFPNPDAVIELDTTGWDVAGAMNNTYTPVVNGWLAIDIIDTATSSVFIYSKGLSADKQYSAGVFGNGTQGTGRLSVMLPALANIQYAFIIKAGSLSDIFYVRFYPCLGNV